ncbi:MAG: hypothetical protein J6Y28_05915 [Acholeplasmatales bacterium]|nr:hypothetical protein [Acholeplasmatales bacterium]
MSRKFVLCISFAIVLLVFIMISYLVIGTNKMTQEQAIAVWFTAGGIVIACGLTFLFSDSKPITSTISIIYVALSIALAAMEMSLKHNGIGGMETKWTVIIQLVLLAAYVIGCLLAGSSKNLNDYEKDENGRNIYKKAG